MTLLALFGGLALLLYGMQLIGEGLQRAAGGHLRHLLTRMTRNRFAAVGSGALVTAIIQSSSATTLMLIGFVSAGLLSFRQSLGVILGADIGTTVTVQLLAFNIQEFSLLLVGAGFAVSFLAHRRAAKSVGVAILGFGFVFLGMKVMTDGLAPIANDELARRVVAALAANPFFGLVAGAALSAGMASSAATIGLALSLAQQGILGLSGAIPVVLGANIGTCATALAASLRSTSDARRVAVAHIAFKVLGVALVFPFISPLAALIGHTAGERDAMIGFWTGYGSHGLAVQNAIWTAATHNVLHPNIFWMYSFLNPDLTYSQSARDMGAAFKSLKFEGVGKLLMESRRIGDGIAVPLLMSSVHGASILGYHRRSSDDDDETPKDISVSFAANRDGWCA